VAFLCTGTIDMGAAGNGQPHRPHFDPAARELPDHDPGPAARRGNHRGQRPIGWFSCNSIACCKLLYINMLQRMGPAWFGLTANRCSSILPPPPHPGANGPGFDVKDDVWQVLRQAAH
jgi:hypothetical protein